MTTFINSKAVIKLALASSISLLSLSYAYAEATLNVDNNIKVTAINGKSVNTSAFKPLQKTFTLTPGKHVITAKYDRLYELRHDDHDYLRSGNVTVSTDIQDNQTYRLTMPGQPERYEEAKEYAKHPTLAVVKGSQIVAKQQSQDNEGGLFSSITGLFGGGSSAQNQNQQAIAAIGTTPKSNSVQSSSAIPAVTTSQAITLSSAQQAPANNSLNQNATTLDRFMQIWLQATPEERAKIRQWVQ